MKQNISGVSYQFRGFRLNSFFYFFKLALVKRHDWFQLSSGAEMERSISSRVPSTGSSTPTKWRGLCPLGTPGTYPTGTCQITSMGLFSGQMGTPTFSKGANTTGSTTEGSKSTMRILNFPGGSSFRVSYFGLLEPLKVILCGVLK